MKKLMAFLFAFTAIVFSAIGAMHAKIVVDEVITHYPWDGKMECVTSLIGPASAYHYKGVFTLMVNKDGEKVRRVITNELGAANSVCTNTFDCAALFGEGVYPDGSVVVDLIEILDRPTDATGDPIGVIGDVLVIDISGGMAADVYPVGEFSDFDLGNFNCDVYKTDKIVLLKIPAGTYSCEPRDADAEEHDVATQQLTTAGFYVGVFPVTQQQFQHIMGFNPSNFSTNYGGVASAPRPVDGVRWNVIRGNVAAGEEITALSGDSFLQRLVAKTGLSGLDLPTEAQWEIACRAGATEEYGKGLSQSNLGSAAWFIDNSSMMTHRVGHKLPNPWGLWDMQGNVSEWCRDVYIETYNTAYVDTPCTETSYNSGSDRVIRGGNCFSSSWRCRPSSRIHDGPNNVDHFVMGFRLSKALP